jgi:Uma2 family endonuclease
MGDGGKPGRADDAPNRAFLTDFFICRLHRVRVCGQPQFLEAERPDTLLNPTLLVEVASSTTALYDRTIKFRDCRALPSLQAYVIVDQDSVRVERLLRQTDGDWLYTEAVGQDNGLELASIGVTLALSAVYRKITFDDVDAVRPPGDPVP